MLIQTGSFVGEAKHTKVPLDFTPELVIVIPETSKRILWRNDTCWHGRTQHFDATPSLYAIGPYIGRRVGAFHGKGFSFWDTLNVVSETYHYIAIKDNGSGLHKSTSWIGNALNGRNINFLTSVPDFFFIKRDSSLPAQFRYTGGANTVSGTFQGGTSSNYALTSTGVTLTNANEVNQNNNAALGEGIEGLAFYDSPGIKITTYTGDGTAARSIALGHTATAAFVIDAVNNATADTTAHCVVTASMSAGNSKRFTDNAIDTGFITSLGANLVLDAGFNVSGRAYVVLSFADQAGTEAAIPDKRGTRCALMPRDQGRLEFADVNLSGACTLEWYGRVSQPSDISGRGATAGTEEGTNILTGLLMLGEGATSTDATKSGEEYNGGIFLASTDPDGNGWRGETIRIVHTDYWSVARAEGSINYYSLNTGIPFPYGRDVHLLVRHDGNGHWRLLIDGKLAKDYNVDLDQATYGNRTNGGAGLDLAVHINSCNVGDSRVELAEMALYRASIWSSELSDSDASARVANAISGSSYSGAAPLVAYDYTGATTPTAVASPNVTHGFQAILEDLPRESKFEGGKTTVGASTTTTLADIIPDAAPTKKRIVGIICSRTAAFSITSATLGGESCTLINAAAGAELTDDRRWSMRWYEVTSGGGDLVIVCSATPTVVAGFVWDASDLTSLEFVGADHKATATLDYSLGISSHAAAHMTKGGRLMHIFAREGLNQDFAPYFTGECAYDVAIDVGATSMAQCATGIPSSFDEHRSSLAHAKNTNALFGSSLLAVRQARPTFSSGRITEDGDLEITFSAPVYAIANPGIEVVGTGISGTVNATTILSGNNTDTITFALDAVITGSATDIEVTYADTSGGLFYQDGLSASFTDEAITNDILVSPTGYDFFITGTRVGSGVTWTNSANITEVAGVATAVQGFSPSNSTMYLTGRNYAGKNRIPTDAIITGLEVRVVLEMTTSPNTPLNLECVLLDSTTVMGSLGAISQASTFIPTTLTYGSDSSVPANTFDDLTAAIKGTDFGIGFRNFTLFGPEYQIDVAYIEMNVHWVVPGGSASASLSLLLTDD